jgi:hypothetical protein
MSTLMAAERRRLNAVSVRKPVTRDEVRLGDWLIVGDRMRIITLPVDAVNDGELIEELWAPLFAELAAEGERRRQKEWKIWCSLFARQRRRPHGYDGTISGSAPLSRAAKPYADYDPRPDPSLYRWKRPSTCIRCNEWFYGGSFSRYCTDKCADAVRVEQRAKAEKLRSEDRARWREDRCDQCLEPMVASRATRRFCSSRCRAAHHREMARQCPHAVADDASRGMEKKRWRRFG